LSPWLSWGHGGALAAGSDSIDPPYPDLVLASGRKSTGIARHIREKSADKTFVVQIQDPRINPKYFDLVVVPQHDPTRGDNVIVTKAGLHRVTPKKLAAAKARWEKEFAKIPKPRVGVLIGGTSKAHTMTAENAKALALQLLHLAESPDIGLLITASRRTGEENAKLLREMLKHPTMYFWDGTGENPYFGFLAIADYIIVTEDSVSMASEALSTGKPVFIAALEGGARRLDMFHKILHEQGYTRPFTGLLEQWSYTPPDDTQRVAEEIRVRMKNKGKQDVRA
jgi:mitochondrial fission protein ELM1